LKKLLLAALVSASLIGGAAVAQADPPPDPGREHGLCTAAFNGKKNGHEDGNWPGPFQDLRDSAPDGSDENDEGGDIADLYDYCQQFGIGGNPDENGRYTTCWTDDDADPDTHNCDD
jgi:hypothetical protein